MICWSPFPSAVFSSSQGVSLLWRLSRYLLLLLLSHLSRVLLLVTLWTLAHQAPLPMGSPRQEQSSELPFPSPGDLSDPGIKLASPALAGEFYTTKPPGKSQLGLFLFYSCHVVDMNLQLQILMVSKCQFLALVVQWLKLCATNSGCLGSTPGQETRFHILQLRVCMLQLKILSATTET